LSLFKPLRGVRQIFDLAMDSVQTSCGFEAPSTATKICAVRISPLAGSTTSAVCPA
jgi:hypothetical protein